MPSSNGGTGRALSGDSSVSPCLLWLRCVNCPVLFLDALLKCFRLSTHTHPHTCITCMYTHSHPHPLHTHVQYPFHVHTNTRSNLGSSTWLQHGLPPSVHMYVLYRSFTYCCHLTNVRMVVYESFMYCCHLTNVRMVVYQNMLLWYFLAFL